MNKSSEYQKQRYIGLQTYTPLGRNVLRLKEPCGISFSKIFSRVSSGTYITSVHVILRPELDCFKKTIILKNNYVTRLRVTGEEVDERGIRLKKSQKPVVFSEVKL